MATQVKRATHATSWGNHEKQGQVMIMRMMTIKSILINILIIYNRVTITIVICNYYVCLCYMYGSIIKAKATFEGKW